MDTSCDLLILGGQSSSTAFVMGPIERSAEFSGNPVAIFVQPLDSLALYPEIVRTRGGLGSIGPFGGPHFGHGRLEITHYWLS
jgi:hypothetical protein